MKLSDEVMEIKLAGGNVYLICGKKNILIDTGIPGQSARLLRELNNVLSVNGNHLDAIFLTHHDVDHVGNLVSVQQTHPVRAYIHPEDLPFASGSKHRPGVKRLVELVLRPNVSTNLSAFCADCDSYDLIRIAAPGHTPGHTIFQYRDFLFVGDLFKTKNGKPIPMGRAMDWNDREMAKSLGLVLSMDVRWLCPAHGEPLLYTKTVQDELERVGNEYATR